MKLECVIDTKGYASDILSSWEVLPSKTGLGRRINRQRTGPDLIFNFLNLSEGWRKRDLFLVVVAAINATHGAMRKDDIIGSFSIDDGDGSENVTFKMNRVISDSVAFIPVR